MKKNNENLEESFGSYVGSSLEAPATATIIEEKPKFDLKTTLSLFRFNKLAFLISGAAVVLILVIGAAAALLTSGHSNTGGNGSSDKGKGSSFATSTLSLSGINTNSALQVGQVDHLSVNGQLRVEDTLVLTPRTAPTAPVTGQIYFDKNSKQPFYYNGTSFVSMAPVAIPQHVTTLGGAAGVISLGSGLQLNGNTLTVASSLIQQVAAASSSISGPRVSSIQGLTGDVTLTAGNGIAISGTTITNNGVVGLTSSDGSVTISPNGSGSYDLKAVAGGSIAGAVLIGPGAAQTDSSNNSLINLDKTGTGLLVQLAANGVNKFVVDQNGAITSGTITYSQVQGAPVTTVTSIGGSSGAITVGSGLNISGNSLSNTGVISLTGTANQVNVSAASGNITVSLPQSIATTSSPTFAGMTLGGALTISSGGANIAGNSSVTGTLGVSGNTTFGGTLGVTGAATFNGGLSVTGTNPFSTGTGVVTLGSLSSGLVQSNGSGVLSSGAVDRNSGTFFSNALSATNGGTGVNGSSAANGSLLIGNGAGFNLATLTAGAGITVTNSSGGIALAVDGTVCTTSGNCSAAGGAGGDLTGTYPNPTIAKLQGTTVTISSLASGQVLQYNGSAVVNGLITNSNLQGGAFANITGTGALASGSITSGFGAISTADVITTTAALQGGSFDIASGNFTVDSSGNVVAKGTAAIQGAGGLTLGVANTTAGKLVFANAGNGHFTTLQGLAPAGQDQTITIPASSASTDTVCLVTLGNCSGSGGTTATGGVAGYLSKFTSGSDITNSQVYDNGTSVGIGTITPGASYILDVNGDTNVTGSLSVTSAVTLGSTLGVTGLSTLSGGASISSGVTIAGGLTATGAIALNTTGTANTSIGNGTGAFSLQSNALNITTAGAVSGVTSLSASGTVTLSGLNSVGVVHTNASGVLSTSAVVLGTDTSGNYVASLGTLTGLTAGGTGGAGGIPTLSVNYGSAANTAVQGNTTLTCAAGAGNLTGGGTSITLGTGGSCGTIDIVNSPTFSGDLSVHGSGGVTIGVAGTTTGLLSLANGTNTNLATLQSAVLGQATLFTLPDPGASTATICLDTGNCASSGGGVTTTGGTSGKLSKFTGSGTIADSSLSESGTTLTASGNIVIQGANSLSLGTASTADGSIKFFNAGGTHTVTLQAPSTDPASNLTFKLPIAYGANGDCLKSDGLGGLSFTACTGGGGGVTSLDSQTGVLTIANSSASGSVITIDDASTAQKGIAQFNSTNFSVTSGVVNTIQDIASSATPTFSGLTLSGLSAGLVQSSSGGVLSSGAVDRNSSTFFSSLLSAANGGTGVNGATAGNGKLLIGNGTGYTMANLTQGSGITITNGSGSISIAVDATVCTTSGNCTTAGAAGGDLTGTYPNPTIAKLQGTTLTLSSLASGHVLQYNGSAVVNGFITNSNLASGGFSNITDVGTLQGGLNIATGQTYKINGAQISSAALSNDSNLAKLSADQTFTGHNTFKTSTNDTLGFQIQNASAVNLFTVDTTNGRLAIGPAAATANSVLTIGTNTTTASGGITFGPDAAVNLYRTGSQDLKTDANFTSAAGIQAAGDVTSGGSVVGTDILSNFGSFARKYPTIGTVNVGDPVTFDGSGAGVAETTTARDRNIVGIVLSTGGGGTFAYVANSGTAQVNVRTVDAVTYGDQLVTSTTAGQATVDNNATTGIIGRAYTTKAGGLAGTVYVVLGIHDGQYSPVFRNASDSTSAFQIQNAAGTSNLLVADTTNSRVGIGTNAPGALIDGRTAAASTDNLLQLYNGTKQRLTVNKYGVVDFLVAETTNGNQIGDISFYAYGNTLPTMTLSDSSGNYKSNIRLGGFTAGTAGLVLCSSTTNACTDQQLFLKANVGSVALKNSSDSTTAFTIQNAAGNGNNFIVDTSNTKIGIGQAPTTSGGALQVAGAVQAVTSSAPGWASGLAGSIVYDSTAGKLYMYDGVNKKEICNKTDLACGSASTGVSDLQGAYDGGNAITLTTGGTSRNLTITVAHNATGTDSSFITNLATGTTGKFAVQNNGTDVFKVDTTGLTVAATSTFTGTSLFNNASNSTTAFQIQNAAGTNIFNVDTTNSKVGTVNVSAASTASQALVIKTGDATGTGGTSNSGALTLDTGSSTNGTAGTINLGTANASGITLSKTGVTTTIAGNLTLVGTAAFQKGTDYSTVGSANDVNFGTGSLIRLTGASAQTITGIANGTDGRILTIVNAGTNAATISNNSGSSSAANRIITGTGGDVSLPAGSAFTLIYDSGASLWRIVSGAAAATGGYVQLQGSTPGSPQTGNLNISGTGIFGTAILAGTSNAFQVSTAGAVTAVGVNSGTGAIQGTGGLTISGAAISLNASSNFSTSINTGTSTGTVSIGNTSAGAITLQSGTSISLNGAASATYAIGASATTGTITVGGAAQTGTLTLGQSTASNTINVGNATIAAGNTGTINIGTSSTSTGKTLITVGSTNDGSSLTLQAGTGNLTLGPSGASNTGVVVKPGTNSTAAFQIQNAAGSSLFNADTTNTIVTIGSATNGATNAWTTQASNQLPQARSYQGTTTYNGYIYIVGGDKSGTIASTVMYAKVNADGSTGAWSCQGQNSNSTLGTYCGTTPVNSNTLPAARSDLSLVAYGGYLYTFGGYNGTSVQNSVFVAKINADGSTGAWSDKTSTYGLPVALSDMATTTYNGYVYLVGGLPAAGSGTVDAYSAKLGANGTLSSWTTYSGWIGAGLVNRRDMGAVVVNGYLYALAGDNGTGNSNIYYGRISADGTLSAASTTASTSLNLTQPGGSVYTMNGYLYVAGYFNNNSGGVTVQYAKVNSDGSVGSWSCQGASSAACGGVTPVNNNTLPAERSYFGQNGVAVNGYMYVIGGNNGSASNYSTSTIYYTSTQRLVVNGSLDLVGGDATSLTDGGTTGGSSGGSLTAGNTRILGMLDVQGSTHFTADITVGGALNALSDVSIGSIGTPTGQLYVSGRIPTVSASSASTSTNPWGLYVQNGFAYVINSGTSFQIFDVSNPTNIPAAISTTAVPGASSLNTVFVTGHYAYLADESTPKMYVYDVSNPTSPSLVSTFTTGGNVYNMTIGGRYAYLTGPVGLQIVDISNPSKLSSVSTLGFGGDTFGSYLLNNYLYVATAAGNLKTVDVSNPASPSVIATSSQTGVTYVWAKGRYVYTFNNSTLLQIFDVSNPTATPTLVGSTAVGTNGGGFTGFPYALYVQGRYAYTTSGDGKIYVVDISTPSSPSVVGSFSAGTTPIDLFVQGRYVFSTDYAGNKLYAHDLGGAYIQQLESGGLQTGTIQVDNNAAIQGTLTVGTGLNVTGPTVLNGDLGISGKTLLANASNSTTSFQIQNASGANLFTADTSNSRLYVGPIAGDTVGALLVLGNKTNAGDPTGVDGAMYYNSSMQRMRCYFDGKWRFCDDPTGLTWGIDIRDDFVASVASSGNFGELSWNNTSAGTGATSVQVAPDVSYRPGQIQFTTGSTTSGYAYQFLGSTGPLLIGGGEEIETSINIPTLADATNDYTLRFGLCDVQTSDCNNGLYFEYNRATTTNWRINAAAGGTRTKTTTATAVGTGWHRFKIVVNASATSVSFYVDGTSIGTVTTNIPTSTANNTEASYSIQKTAGTTPRTFTVDYFEYRNTLTTAR